MAFSYWASKTSMSAMVAITFNNISVFTHGIQLLGKLNKHVSSFLHPMLLPKVSKKLHKIIRKRNLTSSLYKNQLSPSFLSSLPIPCRLLRFAEVVPHSRRGRPKTLRCSAQLTIMVGTPNRWLRPEVSLSLSPLIYLFIWIRVLLRRSVYFWFLFYRDFMGIKRRCTRCLRLSGLL